MRRQSDQLPVVSCQKIPESRPARLTTAFTLVELMISLAMMVVLMLAVNYIFSSVGKATGTAQTISAINRQMQAVQSVMYQDFSNMVTGGPFLLINSARQAAFRARKDELADRDYVAGVTPAAVDLTIRSIDLNGDNFEDPSTAATNPELIPRPILGQRNFRIDQLKFFAQGTFPRQTGNDGTYVANMSGGEAMISYGHVLRPDNSGSYKQLGTDAVNGTSPVLTAQNNPNNFYATQWILGRFATVLVPVTARPAAASPSDPATGIWDNSAIPIWQNYITRGAATVQQLDPLGKGSNDVAGSFNIDWTRYDLAGTSMAGFKTILQNALTTSAGGDPTLIWWDNNARHMNYRFEGDSFVTAKPLSSQGAARTVPVLLEHCTQFIVEYAGDFVAQDNNPASPTYGDVTAAYFDPTDPSKLLAGGTDGKVDYIVFNRGDPTHQYTQIRWYGFPRDTASLAGEVSAGVPQYGSSTPGGKIQGQVAAGTVKNNSMPDVVPLRDIIMSAPGYNGFKTGAAFERIDPTAGNTYAFPVKNDYASNSTPISAQARYVCAWGPPESYYDATILAPPHLRVPPPLPQLIRITIIVDDPDGRLGDGVQYEYVFKLP